MFETQLSQRAVKHPVSGRPKLRPKRIARDKGYSSRKIGALAPGLGPLDSNAARDQTVAPTPGSAVETCA